MTWAPASATGTVDAWIVNHHTFLRGFEVPYAVVNVRLLEQDDCKVIGSWRAPTTRLRGGLRVRACFEDIAGGVTLLSWEPAD
jgi:hypothetical protein